MTLPSPSTSSGSGRVKQNGEIEPLPADPINWGLDSSGRDYWRAYYRNLILTNPRQAALEMDCEPLSLLANVKDVQPPDPSVTLSECLDFYQGRRKKISDEESKKVRNAWKLFTQSVSPAITLEQVTTGDSSLFERWIDAVWLPYEDEGSPKTLRHKVDRVKRVIRYCHEKKQRDKSNCQRLLDAMSALELPDPDKENPNPINVEEFHRLLKAAKGTFWEPMLLVMLNLCYYPVDARTLPVDAVDLKTGVVVFEREKKKTTRVGILWNRTRKALKKWTESGKTNGVVFPCETGVGFAAQGLRSSFRRLRKNAGMGKEVTMNRIRDAAYSAACASPKVKLKEAQILAGHSFKGEADAYVKRDPRSGQGGSQRHRGEVLPIEIEA